jgi:hypothetical protein
MGGIRASRPALCLVIALITALCAPARPATAATLPGTVTPRENAPGWFDYDFIASSGVDDSTGLGCVSFRWDTNAGGTGGTPAGVDASNAQVDWQNYLSNTTGWSFIERTTGFARYAKAAGTTLPSGTSSVGFVLGNVSHPNTTATAYFIFETYTSNDCSTGAVDRAVFAFTSPRSTVVSVTVDPALLFTVAGRATACNSQSPTTFEAGATSTVVSLGRITEATSGGGAQDLSVQTNAGNGFTVYVRGTVAGDDLVGSGGASIADIASTHASPGAAPSAGTAGFGYTTSDTDAGFGAGQFARLTNANETVLVASAGTTSETQCVGYQAAAGTTTPAGVYSATVIYTAVPSF